MAIKFLRCRRIDNPEITADIAESALKHLTGWEPIPDEPAQEQRATETAAAGPEPTPASDGNPALTTRKSRTKAASTDKE